jgi:phage tail sheath gpL-like
MFMIVKLDEGQFDCVYGPYNDREQAEQHRDKLKAKWSKIPTGLRIEFSIVRPYPNDTI